MIHVRDQGPFRLIENVHHTAVAALRIRERREGEAEFSASADTHPQGGDATQIAAPFMSGAVGEAETPTPSEEQPQ